MQESIDLIELLQKDMRPNLDLISGIWQETILSI